jgi:hypothetical protein
VKGEKLLEQVLVIPEGWVALEEAMRVLDRSQRRLQEYVKTGKLKSRRVHLDGRKAPVVIYLAEDVEKLALRHRTNGHYPAPPPPKRKPPEPPAAPIVGLFLTLQQASLYSGLTVIEVAQGDRRLQATGGIAPSFRRE